MVGKNPNMAERGVQANIIAAGIYGAETIHVNKQAISKLRSAVAFALGPKSQKRNVDLAFEVSKTSKDLDRGMHIIYNRVFNVRRMISKNSKYCEIISALCTGAFSYSSPTCVEARVVAILAWIIHSHANT